MKTIAELYTPEDLAWFRKHYGETEFLVHVIGPDTVLRFSDDARTIPFTEETARKTADAYNAFGKRERELSEYAPHIHATVFHHGVPVEADTTVTGVRKALIAESYEHYMNAKRYFPKLKAGQDPTQADFDAAEGRAAAAAYSYLLAVILREAPSRMGEKAASDLASLIDAVQQDGMLAIEEANVDLEEIVYAESLALGVRVRVSRPGAPNFDKTGTIAAHAPYGELNKVGVAIDGREGVQVYAAYDVSALATDDGDNEPPDHLTTPGCFTCGTVFAFTGPKAQQPGTTNCRECTAAVDAR